MGKVYKHLNLKMNFHHELLRDYIAYYTFEKERILRSIQLMDEVQRKAMGIVLEMIDFEILEAQEELDLYLANQRKNAT